MHAERDYLVKSVFPALSEWCEERKLRLIDIDLRWGVTAADSEAKNTVRACLRNIDECRPFFLCFLGQRRGWVPGKDDIGPDTYELFPNLLQKNYVGDTSVTEMEIIHALVDPLHNGILRGTKDDSRSGQAAEYSFFFLREPDYLDAVTHPDLHAIYTNEAEQNRAAADTELARWREHEIPGTGRPVFSYTAEWQWGESTPEIALPLCVPTTAPKDSDAWKAAFSGWEKRWAAAGVSVDDSGEITGAELGRANAYNACLTDGRLGDFSVGGRALAEVIVEQLKDAIAKRYPSHTTIKEQTPLQIELDQQAQFLQIAGEGFIERAGDFDAINEYLQNSENRPFAITAFAGMGKTSLLAHFIDTYHAQEGESLHYRFIGGSDDSVSVERLIRSLLSEMKEAGKIKSEIPANSVSMMNKLPDLLAEAGAGGKAILVIDALNQLDTGMGDLYWIPTMLPENVKLIVSFKLGEETADEYYRRRNESDGMVFHSVRPFDSAADREALVSAYLEQYFKELDGPRIQALIHSDGADNPLFLKAALSELRVFGVHNDLSEVIKNRFGNTPVTAFEAIMARMESDPAYTSVTPAIALPHIFGWIAHSRYGLSVDEMADLLAREKPAYDKDDALDSIYLILRQLRPFLARRDGRIDFLYESFKIAAANRYTKNHPFARENREWHRSLAEYFETLPLENRHRLMEQAWQYTYAGMGGQLKALLWDYDYMQMRLASFDANALIEDIEIAAMNSDSFPGESDHLDLLLHFFYLSKSILSYDKTQLESQLWGRFIDSKQDFIINMLGKACLKKKENGETWLRPVTSSLEKPGSAMRNSFVLGSRSAYYYSPNSNLLVCGNIDSVTLRQIDFLTGKVVRSVDSYVTHIIGEIGGKIVFENQTSLGVWDTIKNKVTLFQEPLPLVCLSLQTIIAGNFVAIVSTKETMIFDIQKMRLSATLPYEGRKTFVQNGSYYAAGHQDGSIDVYNSYDGQLIQTLSGHKTGAFIHVIGIGDDLLSISSNDMIICWDTVSWTKKWERVFHHFFESVYFQNNYLALINVATISVYDIEKQDIIFTWHEGYNDIKSCTFSRNGELLAFGFDNGTILIYDIKKGEKAGELFGHSGAIALLVFTKNDRYLISRGSDLLIKIWRLDSEIQSDSFVERDNIMAPVDSNKSLIVTNENEDRLVWLYDFETLQIEKEWRLESTVRVSAIDALPERNCFMLNNWKTSAQYDFSTGTHIKTVDVWGTEAQDQEDLILQNAKLLKNGQILTMVFERPYVLSDEGEIIHKIQVPSQRKNSSDFCLFDNRGKILFVSEYQLVGFDLGSGSQVLSLADSPQVSSFGVSADEREVIVVSLQNYGYLRFYDIETGEFLRQNPGRLSFLHGRASVQKICCLQGGKFAFLQTADVFPGIYLVDLNSGETVASYSCESRIDNIEVSYSGKSVAIIETGKLSFLRMENLDFANSKGTRRRENDVRENPYIREDRQKEQEAVAEEKRKAALIHYNKGEYDSAAALFEEALAIRKVMWNDTVQEIQLHWVAHLEVYAGICRRNTKQMEEAKHWYLSAIEHYEQLVAKNKWRYLEALGTSYSNLAIIYEENDKKTALGYYEKSLVIWDELKDRDEQKIVKYNQVKAAMERLAPV